MKLRLEIKIKDNTEKFYNDLVKRFKKIAYEMEADAKRFCPVDTGRLRSSIQLQPINEFHYRLQDGVDYGIHVEYGTFKMTAHPFFRPALDIARMKIKMFL